MRFLFSSFIALPTSAFIKGKDINSQLAIRRLATNSSGERAVAIISHDERTILGYTLDVLVDVIWSLMLYASVTCIITERAKTYGVLRLPCIYSVEIEDNSYLNHYVEQLLLGSKINFSSIVDNSEKEDDYNNLKYDLWV
ncbi:hypothetical protein TrispH2_003743 [Trichoplax sp. H2]|uniref:Uncharacterized protein n=1 Tax=Trichoplax adhaerens TaxID=10228 RepID=B3RWV7_TRIAD|nr:predicted protein [Trichoplax adhaerens]EDV25197.1 predicted protein [Trichoplax adhaerens]RDD44543.1 hypothetical protein TrispH2_003743 [Trichoplax sp. H2]|eukprot:XP_002113087.1 predicted protein [Trichoplax adhaerens]